MRFIFLEGEEMIQTSQFQTVSRVIRLGNAVTNLRNQNTQFMGLTSTQSEAVRYILKNYEEKELTATEARQDTLGIFTYYRVRAMTQSATELYNLYRLVVSQNLRHLQRSRDDGQFVYRAYVASQGVHGGARGYDDRVIFGYHRRRSLTYYILLLCGELLFLVYRAVVDIWIY